MRHWLTGEDLVNWLVMLRTADRRAFVVVEGETDCRALDAHVEPTAAETFPAGSKSVATKALELIDRRALERTLVILDRDWVGSLSQPLNSPNLVYTDHYDLDATIFYAGSVLDRVVTAHSDRDKRRADLGSPDASATDLITELAAHVGFARFVSARDRLELNCAGFPAHLVIDATSLEVDVDTLATIAVRRSERPQQTAESVSAEVIQMRASRSVGELRLFCNGHDMATVTAALLRRWGGTISASAVEQAARAALSCSDLRTTKLYGAVADWASRCGGSVWSCAT